MGDDVETPLHPGAMHRHATEAAVLMYDSRTGKPWRCHVCACGEMYLIEPD